MPAFAMRADQLLRVAQGPCEPFPQHQPSPQQADLDVGDAEPQQFGGIFRGQTFHVAQDEHQPILLVQLLQRVVEELLCFGPDGDLARILAPGCDKLRMRQCRIVLGAPRSL